MSDHRRPVVTRSARVVFVGLALFASTLQAQRTAPDPLAEGLGSVWQNISSGQPFRLEGRIETPAGNQLQTVDLELVRFSEEAFDLKVTHPDYAINLRRRGEATALALPKHGVVFRGSGAVDTVDHLAPQGIVARLVSPRTTVAAYLPLILQADPQAVSVLLRSLLQAQYDAQAQQWKIGDKATIAFPQAGYSFADRGQRQRPAAGHDRSSGTGGGGCLAGHAGRGVRAAGIGASARARRAACSGNSGSLASSDEPSDERPSRAPR